MSRVQKQADERGLGGGNMAYHPAPLPGLAGAHLEVGQMAQGVSAIFFTVIAGAGKIVFQVLYAFGELEGFDPVIFNVGVVGIELVSPVDHRLALLVHGESISNASQTEVSPGLDGA